MFTGSESRQQEREMAMGFLPKSKAEKRYTKRLMVTMSVYLVLVFATTWLVRHEHVQGWFLYVCAVLPSLAIFWMLYVQALYLKEETDEFVRHQVVNSLMGATALVLGVTACSDFLRSYTRYGTMPPFTVFVVFWMSFGLMQAVQSMRNRVGGDE
jgi:hypothetical protein